MSEVEQPDVFRIAAFACEQEREVILAIVRAVKAEGHPSGSPYATGVWDAAQKIESAIKERQ